MGPGQLPQPFHEASQRASGPIPESLAEGLFRSPSLRLPFIQMIINDGPSKKQTFNSIMHDTIFTIFNNMLLTIT